MSQPALKKRHLQGAAERAWLGGRKGQAEDHEGKEGQRCIWVKGTQEQKGAQVQ